MPSLSPFFSPPLSAVFGCCLAAFGLLQLPGWALYAVYKQRKLRGSFWQVSLPQVFYPPFTPSIIMLPLRLASTCCLQTIRGLGTCQCTVDTAAAAVAVAHTLRIRNANDV